MKKVVAYVAYLTISLFCFASHPVIAQTNSTWESADGLWSNSNNWSAGVPDGWFNAYITGAAGTVTQDMTDLQLMGLTIDSASANLQLDQSLTVNGVLNFQNGIVTGAGDLNLAAGAVGNFSGGATFNGNLANGGGFLRFQGTANIADSFTINGFSELSGNGIIQGPGELILENAFSWDGGTMASGGLTTINAGSLIFDGTLDRTINNSGQSTISGAGLTGTENAVWNNIGEDSFFKITGDQHLSGEGTFNNLDNGLFKKTGGAGSTNIDWNFNHSGQTILVESGTMSFRSDTNINGPMTVGSGATIEFRGNTTFGENTVNNGDGAISFKGGTHRFDQTYDGMFDTTVSGDAVLTGSADATFHNDFSVNTGSITGSGQLNLYGDSDFSIANIRRTVNNYGNASINNGLITGGFGTWNNQSGAVLNLSGSNNAFLNAGQFTNHSGGTVNASGGNSWIDWNADNAGNVTVNDASLEFRSNFLQESGGVLSLDGGTVEFSGQSSRIGGELSGNGTIIINNDGLVVEGIVAPGTGIETLNFEGDVEFTASTIFDIDVDENTSDFVSVSGDLLLDGEVVVTAIGDLAQGNEYTLFAYDGNFIDYGLTLSFLNGNYDGLIFHNTTTQTIGITITSGIPEPSAALAMLAICAGLGIRRRR